MNTCCTAGSISVYVPDSNKPWNEVRVRHLYNRIGFGATEQEIFQGLAMSPQNLIDQIINAALNMPLPPIPAWVNWDYDQLLIANQCYSNGQLRYNTRDIFTIGEWLRSIAENNNRLRFKMALFWHNHFVTEESKYQDIVYMYEYYHKLLEFGLGNFKAFARAIVTDKAMLRYLDGRNNEVCNPTDIPNENFARELYELFTIGPGNYTDSGAINDVHETARALTGWKIKRFSLQNGWTADDPTAPVYFDPACHDSGMKTIFGQTANFDKDGVIDNLFQQKANEIADFICTKIYAEFVHPVEIDNDIITEMKVTFLNNNFEIEPVVRQLLKSEHFFEACFIGSKVKSPVELLTGFFIQSNISLTDKPLYNDDDQLPTNPPPITAGFTGGVNLGIDTPINCSSPHSFQPYSNNLYGTWVGGLSARLNDLGQNIFNPPNVGGWSGHHIWLSSAQLLSRWDSITFWLNERLRQRQKEDLVDYINNLCNGSIDNYENVKVVLNHFIQREVPFSYDRNDEQNPNSTNDEEVKAAATIFAGSFPQEEFDLGYWSWNYFDVFNQVRALLIYIIRLPAYQLH